ncbi:MAG: CAP domain-containing protein [Actinobacteria bacterium]|nr:CAP domain-containing protein [Actinomycetota bacterium]
MRFLSSTLSLLLIIGVLASAPVASADVGRQEKKLVDLVNEERAKDGKPAVTIHVRLSRRAERHSRAMASANELFHSGTISAGQAEIIGKGPSMRAIVRGFLRSPTHRTILLGRSYSRVGVGVATGHGYKWATLIFT